MGEQAHKTLRVGILGLTIVIVAVVVGVTFSSVAQRQETTERWKAHPWAAPCGTPFDVPRLGVTN